MGSFSGVVGTENSSSSATSISAESEKVNLLNYGEVPPGTHIVHALYRGESIELNPSNTEMLFGLTVSKVVEFIRMRKEAVNLVIPLNGGVPLADSVLRNLQNSNFDFSNLNLCFVKKFMDKGGIHYIVESEDNEGKKTEGVNIMVDDIVDRVKEYKEIKSKLGEIFGQEELICFSR
ncbi:hypothetical protein JW796_00730 [Candidatus Dojkabacteria bacterium]|nr:hypothetical protein [Candidatus Dojkabacteria bacterium]